MDNLSAVGGVVWTFADRESIKLLYVSILHVNGRVETYVSVKLISSTGSSSKSDGSSVVSTSPLLSLAVLARSVALGIESDSEFGLPFSLLLALSSVLRFGLYPSAVLALLRRVESAESESIRGNEL